MSSNKEKSKKTKSNEYAVLSKLAYKGVDKNTDFKKELQRYGLDSSYRVEPSLSSADYTTFTDTRTGKGVLAFRGTKLDNSGDLAADAAIFFGVEDYTKRFRTAISAAQKASKFYGGTSGLTVTGHSLGGSQALAVTQRLGVESHAYNPGKGLERFRFDNLAGPLGTIAGGIAKFFGPKDKSNKQNTTIYTTGWDPISWGTASDNATFQYSKPSSLDVHGIDNFIPKEKRRSQRIRRKQTLCTMNPNDD